MMANMSDLLDGNFIKLIILNTTFLIVLLRAVFFRFSKDRESLFGFFIFDLEIFPEFNLTDQNDFEILPFTF